VGNVFPDYPKYAVWPDGYYMASNESDVGIWAFDRSNMLAGAAATYQKKTLNNRNFGSHATLVGNFTVDVTGSKLAGIRWFELRKTGSQIWNLYQEGTYSPDSNHRWMGSVAMNGNGDIALGYSVSSSTVYPSIRVASRLSGNSLGILGDETNFITSAASQTGGNRWGDYSAMTVDPVDNSFWYTHEYVGSDNNWRTRIINFNVVPEPITFGIFYLTLWIFFRNNLKNIL